MNPKSQGGIADLEGRMTQPVKDPVVTSPAQALADAINRTGDSNEVLSRRTRGEVGADRIGRFRSMAEPVPHWKEIAKLLSRCRLSPSKIGQRLRED